MSEKQATLGRIVHYHPHAYEADEGVQTVAAIITQVNADGTVNLTALSPSGGTMPKAKVVMADHVAPGCWSWPPRV